MLGCVSSVQTTTNLLRIFQRNCQVFAIRDIAIYDILLQRLGCLRTNIMEIAN